MNNKYTCCIINPMGKMSPEVKEYYDTLIDFGIKPALERLGFVVQQGNFQTETGEVDANGREQFRNADLCVADICDANSTEFFYELGKREGREKPTVLLKSAVVDDIPFLASSAGYIEYDLSNRRFLPETQSQFTAAVEGMLKGVLNKQSEVTLFSINEKMDKMIQSISRLYENRRVETRSDDVPDDWSREDPMDLFRYAVVKRDLKQAEYAMKRLESSMDKVRFYDIVVEQTTALGSRTAGEMLINQMEWFTAQKVEMKKKIEYLGVLVSYLNRTDQEYEYQSRVEAIASQIMAEDSDFKPSVHNQLNRLYYGIYQTKKDVEYLNKAIKQLEEAIALEPDDSSYYYNLALCYKVRSERVADNDSEKKEFFEEAVKNIRQCLKKQGDRYDEDHLALGCRILRQAGDPDWQKYFDVLQGVSPIKHAVLAEDFKREDSRKQAPQPKEASE